jgi:D-alanyl-D-alanine carboxypeptidase/D-alanyl-D-alanine carboxypeptidase (penicillin-binding protein 5/6)
MKNLKLLVAFTAILIIITGVSPLYATSAENAVRTACVTLTAPEVSAVSAIVIDARTGKVLYEKNADEIRAVASLTKVMTTILTLEAALSEGDLDAPFQVDNGAIHVEGTSMGLRENDIVTRRALAYGMMLPSGNDASNAAAVSVSGSISEFVKHMNIRARQIGMDSTKFANPHGLDQRGHLSTARDMAVLTAYAMERSEASELFREICSSRSVQLEFGNPPYKRWLRNNNRLLAMYPDCTGVKTGFTDSARRCLISAAQRDGRRIIAVTLSAPDDWNDHMTIMEYSFTKLGILYGNYE